MEIKEDMCSHHKHEKTSKYMLQEYFPNEIEKMISAYRSNDEIFKENVYTSKITDIKEKYKNSLKNTLNTKIEDGYIIERKKDKQVRWIYIDDKNKDIINSQIKDSKYKNVGFYGPITGLGNGWASNCINLHTVDYMGLDKLISVGNGWMFHCVNLQTVNFNGLDKLISVGDDWMRSCVKLHTVDFYGLDKLISVGNFWLSGCVNLQTIKFMGLDKLISVGNEWMIHCSKLHIEDKLTP